MNVLLWGDPRLPSLRRDAPFKRVGTTGGATGGEDIAKLVPVLADETTSWKAGRQSQKWLQSVPFNHWNTIDMLPINRNYLPIT